MPVRQSQDAEGKESSSVSSGSGDDFTYVDMGDHTIEIDNRGPEEVRRVLPKSIRSVGIDPTVRQQLEARVEGETAAAEPWTTEETLPPAEDEAARKAREKKAEEQLAPKDGE